MTYEDKVSLWPYATLCCSVRVSHIWWFLSHFHDVLYIHCFSTFANDYWWILQCGCKSLLMIYITFDDGYHICWCTPHALTHMTFSWCITRTYFLTFENDYWWILQCGWKSLLMMYITFSHVYHVHFFWHLKYLPVHLPHFHRRKGPQPKGEKVSAAVLRLCCSCVAVCFSVVTSSESWWCAAVCCRVLPCDTVCCSAVTSVER